jgi:hypothetical protein
MEYYERMDTSQAPQQRRKKERKLDEEKIDESPGKIPIIQKHPTKQKGEKGKEKEQIKRTQVLLKDFLLKKKPTHTWSLVLLGDYN